MAPSVLNAVNKVVEKVTRKINRPRSPQKPTPLTSPPILPFNTTGTREWHWKCCVQGCKTSNIGVGDPYYGYGDRGLECRNCYGKRCFACGFSWGLVASLIAVPSRVAGGEEESEEEEEDVAGGENRAPQRRSQASLRRRLEKRYVAFDTLNGDYDRVEDDGFWNFRGV